MQVEEIILWLKSLIKVNDHSSWKVPCGIWIKNNACKDYYSRICCLFNFIQIPMMTFGGIRFEEVSVSNFGYFLCPNMNTRRSLNWKKQTVFGNDLVKLATLDEEKSWFAGSFFSMKMSKGRFVFFVWLTLVFNVIVIQRWDSLVVLFNNLFVIMWVGFEQNLAPIKKWIKNPQKQNPVDPYPWAEK